MARIMEYCLHTCGHGYSNAILDDDELTKCLIDIFLVEQRHVVATELSASALRTTLLALVVRYLNMGSVIENDLSNVSRSLRAVNRTAISVTDEHRESTRVIKMSVRKQHRIHGCAMDAPWHNVASIVVLIALEHAEIDKHRCRVSFEHVGRSRDLACSSVWCYSYHTAKLPEHRRAPSA